jgi:hypothetical protein
MSGRRRHIRLAARTRKREFTWGADGVEGQFCFPSTAYIITPTDLYDRQETDMITAIVRYRLPATIGRNECLEHFHRIAPGFSKQKGFIRKQFIWSENGIAGGVYQWATLADAKAFYQGPWLDGILSRYGVYPEIEYFVTFAVAEQSGEVIYTEPPVTAAAADAAA